MSSRHPEKDEGDALVAAVFRLSPDDPQYQAALDRAVAHYTPVALRLAGRFRDRGEAQDDLRQVALLGLVQAVQRFDPERGDFLAYAVPTVLGELKRWFRDQGWGVRVPRRLQELHLRMGGATAELSQKLGRAPRPSELAEHLGTTPEEVLEALRAQLAYVNESLDRPVGDEPDAPVRAETMGDVDPAFELVEYREALAPHLAALDARSRRILLLRFFGGKTQTEIAQELGISQMHVSRLLARTLAQLRQQVGAPPEAVHS